MTNFNDNDQFYGNFVNTCTGLDSHFLYPAIQPDPQPPHSSHSSYPSYPPLNLPFPSDDLVCYKPSELSSFAQNEEHYSAILKERRRVQVKFNVQKLRMRRQKEELQNEVAKLKEQIENYKEMQGIHFNHRES